MAKEGRWVWAWVVVVGVVGVVVESRERSGVDSQYCSPLADQPDPPPKPDIAEQYTAGVEVSRIGDKDIRLMAYADYHYDMPRNKVALKFLSKYSLLHYILDWNTGQMVHIRVPKDGQEIGDCTVRGLEEATYLFPVLWGSGQNISLDSIIGPGVLLGILEWNITHYKGEYEHRGMLASRWDWCGLTEFEHDAGTTNVTMATYWSAPTWIMPIPETQTIVFPLGWEVVVWPQDPSTPSETPEEKPEVHSVMYYRPGEVDEAAFLIPQDLYCSVLVGEPNHPFPDFSKDRLFTFSLEVRESAVNTITWADGWYDFEKQLYRIDHDVLSTPRETVTSSEILDFNDGLSFTVPWGYGEGVCRINVINNTKTDWADITGIEHLWADSPNAFFGSDITNYTYYGPGISRYIEGDEWRGMRSDWPSNAIDGNTHMVWQWTFANKNVSTVTSMGEHLFFERQVPISLRVTALHDIETSEGRIPKGSAYIYQLYNFDLESDEREDLYSDAGVFDTYQCYSANWRDHLRFKLDVSSWPEVVELPIFTSTRFWEYWQKLLAEKATVSPLRITRVKTLTEEDGQAWVEFVLLYRHPEISKLDPDLYRKMTPGSTAKTYISEAINKGDIKFEGITPQGENFELVAKAGSLAEVIEPDCSLTTPTTSTTTTPAGHTPPHTATPPGHITTHNPGQGTGTPPSTVPSSTSTTTPSDNTGGGGGKGGGPAYSSGELAGLGVGMLLAGLAFGAGGTFLLVMKNLHLTVLAWFGKAPK